MGKINVIVILEAKMKKKALIIDGNSIINRAFYGIRAMSTPDGFPTNAIYGFLNIYQGVKTELGAEYVAVAFDLKAATHRHKEFSDYKAGRKSMPDDLAMQMPVLKEILRLLGVEILELAGFEADDILGTAAAFLSENNVETYLLTGDKDALQLVRDNIFVYYHGTKKHVIYDRNNVYQDLGVYPERVVDLKGLMGDSSDNIPGINGIGKVSALKLLAEFDSVEDLIARSEEISNKRWQKMVNEQAEQALLSKKLATIVCDMLLEFELSDFALTPAKDEELLAILKKYRLNRFIESLGIDRQLSMVDALTPVEEKKFNLSVFAEVDGVADFFRKLKPEEPFYLLSLYDKKTIVDDELLTLALAQGEEIAIFEGEALKFAIDSLFAFSQKQKLKLVANKLKQTLLILKRYGIDNIKPLFDPQIAMYLIDANRSNYDLADLALDFLGRDIISLEKLVGKGSKRKLLADIESEKRVQFAEGQLKALIELYPLLNQQLEQNGATKLFEEIEMPLSAVLADLEYQGVSVDESVLDQLGEELKALIEDLESQIYRLAGKEFNINSPKQLSVVLFEDLELPALKKTKTGYSTSHDILLKLKKKHEIIPLIIEYRSYSKLMSTYVDGLRDVINPITGKIHSSFNQTVAATGRLSSKEPNLQNIPVRLAFGRRLRKVFTASEGNVLVDADYSQIELRVLAHISADPLLLKAYQDNIDIHALTASQVFDTPLEEVTPELRSRAKEVNFGIVYGMSDFGLSETLHIAVKTAKNYIDNYFAKYPLVKAYMEKSVADCKEKGYAETMLGRRRKINEINHKNHNLRQYGERMAMNTPIQGTAADIIKKAMVDVYHMLEDAGLKSKLILQVHDELMIDTLPEELDEVKHILKEAMENAVKLDVPISIDMNVGKNWYEAK